MNANVSAGVSDYDTVEIRPLLRIRGLRVRPVDVPMTPPVQTAAGVVRSAPLVLVDLTTEEGITGSAYVFTYVPLALGPTANLISNLEPLIAGQPLAPLALSRSLAARFRLLGPQGLVGLALSAIDMAAWDAHARALGVPLCRVLGATGTERIETYASLRGSTAGQLTEEADAAKAAGFTAVKLKFGQSRTEEEVISAIRDVMGDAVRIMVDYNQALGVADAIERASVLDALGIHWIEEPVRADDYAGHAAVARAARTPIQLGENYWGPHEVARSISAGASDLMMPDLMKIGGVTGLMATSALCEAAGLPVSSHLFVEYSSHLLAATPGRHFLEWLDIAAPVLATGSPKPDDGFVLPTDGPGAGLSWDEDAVRRFTFA